MGVYQGGSSLLVSEEAQTSLIALSLLWMDPQDKPDLFGANSKSILEANISPLCEERLCQLWYQQRIFSTLTNWPCQ